MILYSALLGNKTNWFTQKPVSRVPNRYRRKKLLDLGSYDLSLRPKSTQKQQIKERREVIVFSSSILIWTIEENNNAYPHKLKVPNGLKSLKAFCNYIKLFHKLVSHIYILQLSISKVWSNSYKNLTFLQWITGGQLHSYE